MSNRKVMVVVQKVQDEDPVAQDGSPILENREAHLATLQRRREHLLFLLNRPKEDQRPKSVAWDAAEASALKSAIRALKYHGAYLGDDESAETLLVEMVDALEQKNVARSESAKAEAEERLQRAHQKARRFVDDLEDRD